MSYHHQVQITAIDINPVAIETAKSIARRIRVRPSFEVADLFEFVPAKKFELVVSLGVLHHTSSCEAAIRRVCRQFLAEDGTLMLGLYHSYGRRPFLDFFSRMQADGASEFEMLEKLRELSGGSRDNTHVYSWFRDKVLHPHETQHTYAVVSAILRSEGLRITSTSLNRFLPLEDDEIELREKECEDIAKHAIHAGRYYPGFFVVFAERTS
jgi:2-polyprenyl-3-methyl-5-hydroxy-6-metoxy-1,4-benzoquinol methylase